MLSRFQNNDFFFLVVVVVASAIFGWWLPCGGTDGLALLCTPLAFLTVLCGLLRESGHLFDLFFTFYNYFSIVLVYCWETYPFFICRIVHFFFLLDQKWEGSSLVTLSRIQLKKKIKKNLA
jgi:hypothetical protein